MVLMATECGCEESWASSPVPGSPKNKVKFLCSHGGKILPRPSDGHLKYVGGETRVISVYRDIKFSELMVRLSGLFDGDMVFKYQLIPEDLETLVTVKSDEDLRHMLDEHDRHESEGAPRLRAFLFPANQVVVDTHFHSMDAHYSVEQRYIDAINGIIRAGLRQSSTQAIPQPHSASSAGSSPRSPENSSPSTPSQAYETMLVNGRLYLHKVQSSPSLCNPNVHHHQHQGNHHHHHTHSQPYRPLPHQLQLQLQHQHQHHGHQPVTRTSPWRESWRYQMSGGSPTASPTQYQSPTRRSRGSGCGSKCTHFEECCGCGDRKVDRSTDSLSPSPPFTRNLSPSPRS